MRKPNRNAISSAITRLHSIVERWRLMTIVRILLFLLIVWVVGANWLYFTEKDYVLTPEAIAHGERNYFDSYARCYKNILVYLVSGFEEYIPHTFAGWFGSVLVMLVGSFGVVAMLVGNVASIIHDRLEEAKLIRRKPAHGHFRGHLVICNWSEKGPNILRQIKDEATGFDEPVVIVSEQAAELNIENEKPLYKDVWVVAGDPANADNLRKADIEHAATVLILAGSLPARAQPLPAPVPGAPASSGQLRLLAATQASVLDARTVLIAMTIEALSPQTYTCVELLDWRNRIHLERTHIDEVVCAQQFSSKLLAQACISHGLTEVYQHLLTATGDTNEIYVVPFTEDMQESDYFRLRRRLRQSLDCLLLGYEREATKGVRNHFGAALKTTQVVLNPKRDRRYRDRHKLQPGDRLVILAYRRPRLEELTDGKSGERENE